MNDILPKPFTKEGLLGMVEKHLIHLKTMQQLSEIPRALGLPPLNDQALSEALQSNAQAAIPTTSATSASTATTSTSTDINENNNENRKMETMKQKRAEIKENKKKTTRNLTCHNRKQSD